MTLRSASVTLRGSSMRSTAHLSARSVRRWSMVFVRVSYFLRLKRSVRRHMARLAGDAFRGGTSHSAGVHAALFSTRQVRSKARDSALLSVSGALKELAAPVRPSGFPPEEWAIVKHATEEVWWGTPNPGRLADMPRSAGGSWRR